MAQGSTDTEQPVEYLTTQELLGWHTEPYLVELSLSSTGKGIRSLHRLSIEVPTFEEGSSIFQQVSVRLLSIAGRDRSSGGSVERNRHHR